MQLITRIKEGPQLSIQLDETMDITKLSQLLVCVRYVYTEIVDEELLFCRPFERLEGKTYIAKLTNC